MTFNVGDDAVHIESPWLVGTALCGETRGLNSVTLTDPRPDSVEGCWTCLYAAEWLAAFAPLAAHPSPSGGAA